MNKIIAIDGPSASGKSTVARKTAQKLGWCYVDSGSMYRSITWIGLLNKVDFANQAEIQRTAESAKFEFKVENGGVSFTINGKLPGDNIRSVDVNNNVSKVAAVQSVRALVNEHLRKMLGLGNLVIEGRDIGTAVFPETPYKFYLDASPEERAKRRHAEIAGKQELSVNQVDESLKRRDKMDSSRRVDPLKIASDAHVIDSTGMTIDQVVDHILRFMTT